MRLQEQFRNMVSHQKTGAIRTSRSNQLHHCCDLVTLAISSQNVFSHLQSSGVSLTLYTNVMKMTQMTQQQLANKI